MTNDAKENAVISAARDLDHWLYNVLGAQQYRRLMRQGMPAQNLHDALHRLDGGLPLATRIAENMVIVVADTHDLDPELINAIYKTAAGETVDTMQVLAICKDGDGA